MLTAKLSAPHLRREASSTKPHTSQSRGRVKSSDCDLPIFSYDVYLRNDDDFCFLLGVWAGWDFICIVAESSRLTHTRMDACVVNVKHTYAHRATHTHSHTTRTCTHTHTHTHTHTPTCFSCLIRRWWNGEVGGVHTMFHVFTATPTRQVQLHPSIDGRGVRRWEGMSAAGGRGRGLQRRKLAVDEWGYAHIWRAHTQTL